MIHYRPILVESPFIDHYGAVSPTPPMRRDWGQDADWSLSGTHVVGTPVPTRPSSPLANEAEDAAATVGSNTRGFGESQAGQHEHQGGDAGSNGGEQVEAEGYTRDEDDPFYYTARTPFLSHGRTTASGTTPASPVDALDNRFDFEAMAARFRTMENRLPSLAQVDGQWRSRFDSHGRGWYSGYESEDEGGSESDSERESQNRGEEKGKGKEVDEEVDDYSDEAKPPKGPLPMPDFELFAEVACKMPTLEAAVRNDFEAEGRSQDFVQPEAEAEAEQPDYLKELYESGPYLRAAQRYPDDFPGIHIDASAIGAVPANSPASSMMDFEARIHPNAVAIAAGRAHTDLEDASIKNWIDTLVAYRGGRLPSPAPTLNSANSWFSGESLYVPNARLIDWRAYPVLEA